MVYFCCVNSLLSLLAHVGKPRRRSHAASSRPPAGGVADNDGAIRASVPLALLTLAALLASWSWRGARVDMAAVSFVLNMSACMGCRHRIAFLCLGLRTLLEGTHTSAFRMSQHMAFFAYSLVGALFAARVSALCLCLSIMLCLSAVRHEQLHWLRWEFARSALLPCRSTAARPPSRRTRTTRIKRRRRRARAHKEEGDEEAAQPPVQQPVHQQEDGQLQPKQQQLPP